MTLQKRKKVLFLITKSNWGGAQRYVFDLATNLNPNQYEVVVALGGDGALISKLAEAGIKTINIAGLTRDISLIQELKAMFAIASIVRKERPDVLHVNSSKAGAIGALVGRVLRVPRVIFTAHGWAFNEDRPQLQKNVFKALHWLTVLLSHCTVAVSTVTKTQMNWPGVQNKMTVIHPGRSVTDLKHRFEARGILETKMVDAVANLSEYHADIWVGTIAELHPVKQLNRAIDSIASLSRTIPTVRYIIIGAGQCESALQQQVANLGIEQHVFFAGAVHEAARLLPAFDVFVLPSQSEAFGYVLLEAGIAHVPVVATNTGGITDIITNNETGLLVPVHDTPALTRALQTLLTDTKMRKKLADANAAVVNEFTIENMVEKTTQVYRT
jgi:glycosyltransferase involved in cell wall biosynthesis